jgi:hypothetical protein
MRDISKRSEVMKFVAEKLNNSDLTPILARLALL